MKNFKETANFIWSIADLLRGDYKQSDYGKVILAEFGYDNKLMPSFPFDQTIPRKSMWILKRWLLPILYWYGMVKGALRFLKCDTFC